MRTSKISFWLSLFGCLCLWSAAVLVNAQDTTPEAQPTADETLIARGSYLAEIAGCVSCHSPVKAEFAVDPTTLTPEQLQQLVMFPYTTLDKEERRLAGGRAFDLGPAGILLSRNLTPDEKTGIGTWTDEQIENAIRIGVRPDGTRLHPLMPYRNLYTIAESDLRALIAYLRSLPAIDNEVVQTGPSGEGIAPELVPPTELLDNPPDGSNPVELGSYLINSVMSCTDCHTPLDPETGAPLADKFLAGGQPYEGPWGIVYGGNITPHPERGIGNWTDDEIRQVFRKGISRDGRQLILMPWEDYEPITDSDLNAVIAYLRSITPVDNEVPAPAVNDAFKVYQPVEATPAPTATASSASSASSNILPIALGVGVVIVLAGGAFIFLRSRNKA